MAGWALDLGTTNSAVARWDEALGEPRLIELSAVCRKVDAIDPLEAPRLTPSAVDFVEKPGLIDRLGSWSPLQRRFFFGRRALIGRQALERNDGVIHPSFVPAFKPALSHDPKRLLARVGRKSMTARETCRAFLRELLCEVKRATGHRIRDLVVTSPVTAFEAYRAEVLEALRQLDVRRVRFVDEPVAAAIGYGISLYQDRTILVVDVGGGTMHVVLARLSPGAAMTGQATVLAKRGRPLGGNAVDGWVLEELCAQMGHEIDPRDNDEPSRAWRRLMLAEACRVKEAVYFEDGAEFLMSPLGMAVRSGPSRPGAGKCTLTCESLRAILEKHGFYRSLAASVEEVLEQARVSSGDVDELLLVGGSTLLPGFYSFLEQRFDRRRLRAWQPFEAVAYGAACFAADQMRTLDYIVHDYAFETHDAKTGKSRHVVIVPKGTRYPTPPDFWKHKVVPTCALGEPETIYKLVICEVSNDDGERRFVWDAAGDVRKVGGASGEAQVIVPLNAASPTLGYLDPPHTPDDKRPRLEIAFGINSERWLIATVRDLLAQRELMRQEPIVRLL